MAIKIMDSFEPAGSGFKVVDAKDISVTENVEHDLKYALKIIGYLLGLTTDTTGLDNYLDEHAKNSAKTVSEIESDILNLLRLIVGDPSVTASSNLSDKTLNVLKDAIDKINGDVTTDGSFANADTNLLKSIIGDGSSTDLTDRTLKAIKQAIDIINGSDNGSFANADTNLLKSIIGDDGSADLTNRTLKALKTAIDKIDGDVTTDGSFKKADKDQLESILSTISGVNDWTSIVKIADTHKLNSLYTEIEKLKDIHELIHSVTYYAGVFDTQPDLTSLTTGSEVKDSDDDPKFILKPGIVITVGEVQYITVKDSYDESVADYRWENFGTATVYESRFQNIEGEIGTKDSTAVNNGDIWDNIKNIYSMLGALTIDSDDDKVYEKINSLKTSLGEVADTKPANTVWESIKSLYSQVKDGDIKINSTSYTITNESDDTKTKEDGPFISRIWAGSKYTFKVTHVFNKTPIISASDNWTITGNTATKNTTNVNTISVTATDAYGKSITKTNTIYLEYPVLVELYKDTMPTGIVLPESSASAWYKQYTITVDGSNNNNIMVLVYNPSDKDVKEIITDVTGNGFNVEGAFVKDNGYDDKHEDYIEGYVRYTLANNVMAGTEYKFTINKITT